MKTEKENKWVRYESTSEPLYKFWWHAGDLPPRNAKRIDEQPVQATWDPDHRIVIGPGEHAQERKEFSVC